MAAKAKKSRTPKTLSLTGATVVLPKRPGPTACAAAAELARFLYELTGEVSQVSRSAGKGPAVWLGDPGAARAGVAAESDALGEQGYRLAAVEGGVAIAAASEVGLLYGVYGLLEELGMGFYAGGPTYPDLPSPAEVPAGLDQARRPAFDVRGNLLHYNFLVGPTCWGADDYKFYFDQLARMRCNMLLMHWYDDEPGAAATSGGEYVKGGPTPNSLSKPWGAIQSRRTSEFDFATGRFYDAEIYSSPAGEDLPDLVTEIKRSEDLWREATAYARTLGIGIAAGFEMPRTDPTDTDEMRLFLERLDQFVSRNPNITHVAIWQHESGGCFGSTPPEAGSAAAELLAAHREHFEHLGNERRVWEAVRAVTFAKAAADWLTANAPQLGMVMVGWGGDRWMRWAEGCLGFDKILPEHVVFTCHDNIDASFGPNVSTAWGQLPETRQRWAMPWVEGDIEECWVRQPNVESLGSLAPDALAKGAQGLMTLQWRTRDVEEETGYIAQYAWNTDLKPKDFYARLACDQFGPDHQKDLAKMIGKLQKAGSRWTGVRGAFECGEMLWTGRVPHYPFDLDASVPGYLMPLVAEAADALAAIPADATDAESGAYHLRPEEEGFDDLPRDESRPGVAEFREFYRRLESLQGTDDEKTLRKELDAIAEQAWDVRAKLIHHGMSSTSYRTVDGFMIALHHLKRNAGASKKLPRLRKFRKQLAALREELPTHRLERLDYLTATMDFATHFDSCVMLLADGEQVDQALAEAETLKNEGNDRQAGDRVAEAYGQLIDAGMADALAALTDKLTTECDWGVLTTVNVKALPLYWQAFDKMEPLMPAVPPRQLTARGRCEQVYLSWQPSGKADAQKVYRRAMGSPTWTCVHAAPLAGTCQAYVDTPGRGAFEYAVTALNADGWESPRSHPARAACGPQQHLPRIVAAKPFGLASAKEDLPLNVQVIDDLVTADVRVYYRQAGKKKYRHAALHPTFRNGWAGAVPGKDMKKGLVEYYVQAIDAAGNRTTWPRTAEAGLCWTVAVL